MDLDKVTRVDLSSITDTMHYKEYCKVKIEELKGHLEAGGFKYISPSMANTDTSPFSKVTPANIEISEEVIDRNKENRRNIIDLSRAASKYKKDNCNKCVVKQGCRGLSEGKVLTSCAGPVKKMPNKTHILQTIREEINYLAENREVYKAISYFSGYQADKSYGTESSIMIAGFVSKRILDAEGALLLKSLKFSEKETNYNELAKIGVVLLRNTCLMASAVSGEVYNAYKSSRNRRELVFGDYLYNSGIMYNNLIAEDNPYPGWYAKILLQTGVHQGNIVYVDMDVALRSIYGKHITMSIGSAESLFHKASDTALFENIKPYYYYSWNTLFKQISTDVPNKDLNVESLSNVTGHSIPKTRIPIIEILPTLRDVELDREALEKYLLLMASPLRMTKIEGGGFGAHKKTWATMNAYVKMYPGSGIVSAEQSSNEYRYMDMYSCIHTAGGFSKLTLTLTHDLPDIRTPYTGPVYRRSYNRAECKGSVKAIDLSKKASATKFNFIDLPLEDTKLFYADSEGSEELSLNSYVRTGEKTSSEVFSGVSEDSNNDPYVAAMSLATSKTMSGIKHFVMGLNAAGELCFRDVNTDQFKVAEFAVGTSTEEIKASPGIAMLAEERVKTVFGDCSGKEREINALKVHYATNISKLLDMVNTEVTSNGVVNVLEKVRVMVYKRPATRIAKASNGSSVTPMYVLNTVNIVETCPKNDSDPSTRNTIYRGSLKLYGADEGSIYMSRLSQAVYSYKTSRHANKLRVDSWRNRRSSVYGGSPNTTGYMYDIEVFNHIIGKLGEDDN
jgi:hypothetical protein